MATFHPLLAAYKPDADDPFDGVKAAHLLNRAGFGGTPDDVAHVQKIGPEAAVDELLDFPDASAEEQNADDVPDLSTIAGLPKNYREIARQYEGKTEEEKKMLRAQFMVAQRQALVATGAWWMKRMAYGKHPLQEKLALFWHGHFTTSAKDERSASLMWQQNELLRQYAAGNFGKFVHAISRDPAMLDYLNNTQNHRQHPNENYARELMELFTLGIGNYTENDVKEGARAFTGWTHDGESYVFRANQHDPGPKVFLGHRGNFNGDDVIDIILQQPACPRYIAGELFKYFVYEDVDESLSAGLSAAFRDGQGELRPLLRTILTSKAFYSPAAIGAQIKSPVQLVAGTIRLLGVAVPPEQAIIGTLTQMGQVPFVPPNVRGWPGGQSWINTSTLFVRYNTGVWLTGGDVPAAGGLGKPFGGKGNKQRRGGGRQPSGVHFEPTGGQDADAVVDQWVLRLIQRPIDPAQRKVLIDALDGQPQDEESVRRMVQLIVSMPEYQLC